MRFPLQIDRYMLRHFLPLLLLTFLICWFIVTMQFIWRYTDDFVGKGLDLGSIFRILMDVALMVVPTALPLGILLAGIMTFGGLGERLELLAIKSSGMPLIRIMLSLSGVTFLLSIGLFFYLNKVVMEAQVKFFQMVFSVREARPDLDLPEGTFFSGIKGYNLFVREKDHERKTLNGLMIYDQTDGFDRTRIIVADSGRLRMDTSKTFLTLDLFDGESFQLLGNEGFLNKDGYTGENVPPTYYKEQFRQKRIIIPFDANFKLQSDEDLRGQFVGKNLAQLTRFIQDTARYALDSVGQVNRWAAINGFNSMRYEGFSQSFGGEEALLSAARVEPFTLDSLEKRLSAAQRIEGLTWAQDRISSFSSDAGYMFSTYDWQAYYYRTHDQERHRKFTFPVACLLFFFIGAPLGSIIRKGGIGTPMVTSVLLFIIYYMVDTYGYKMSYNGQWPVWIGMWLSSFLLLPTGVILTWLATRDSARLNVDALGMTVKRFLRPVQRRSLTVRELVLQPMEPVEVEKMIAETERRLHLLQNHTFLSQGYLKPRELTTLNTLYHQLYLQLEGLVDRGIDYKEGLLLAPLQELPQIGKYFSFLLPRQLWGQWILLLTPPLALLYIPYLYTLKVKKGRRLKRLDVKLQQLKTTYQKTWTT